jgi:hypothetical protein
MLHDAGLDESFWAEAVKAANHVKNRSASEVCGGITPYEIWYGRKPSIGYMKVFGCTAYVHIPSQVRTGKFSERARKGIFIGYEENGRGYRIWDPVDKKVLHSRDVKFVENFSGVRDSEMCDLLGEDVGSESDSDVVRFRLGSDVRGDDRSIVRKSRPPCNRTSGFWEVGDDEVEDMGSGSEGVERVDTAVQAEVHREKTGDRGNIVSVEDQDVVKDLEDSDESIQESDSNGSDDEEESREGAKRWVAGESLRERTGNIKPASYGMVAENRLKSIFDDSDTDDCDLSRFVDPSDF